MRQNILNWNCFLECFQAVIALAAILHLNARKAGASNVESAVDLIKGEVASDRTDLRGAPDILVTYASNQHAKLVFTNHHKQPALIRRIGPLACRERYEGEYELPLIPSTPPPVTMNAPVECELGVRDPWAQVALRLEEILRRGGTNTVILDYDSSGGHEFSRLFTLTTDVNGGVAWTSGPIMPRGQAALPPVENQSLAPLRAKLDLADAYPKERMAAQRYGKDVSDLRHEVEHYRAQLQTVAGNRRMAEAAALLTLFAREAIEINKYLRSIVGPEVAAANHPLRTLTNLRDDGIEWRDTHRSIYVFQSRYMKHIQDVKEWIGLYDPALLMSPDVLVNYEVNPDDEHTPQEVCGFLEEHSLALRTQAAKLREEFDASATISETDQTR